MAGLQWMFMPNSMLQGDLIFDARVSYRFFKFLRASFIVKNLGNKLYAIRPSKAEPIRNYTLQLQFDI